MVLIENGIYVVRLPEHGVFQNMNPANGQTFASEAQAIAWELAFLATVTAQQAGAASARDAVRVLERVLVMDFGGTQFAAGSPVPFTATYRNGNGTPVTGPQVIDVPFELNGAVTILKRLSFVAGATSGTVNFKASGIYKASADSLSKQNSRAIGFAPMTLTIFE